MTTRIFKAVLIFVLIERNSNKKKYWRHTLKERMREIFISIKENFIAIKKHTYISLLNWKGKARLGKVPFFQMTQIHADKPKQERKKERKKGSNKKVV